MTSSEQAPKDPWPDGRPLLRWGLTLLRRWSRNHRYAYLYPDGPNPKVVFSAYQSFCAKLWIRQQSRGKVRSPRWMRRHFKKQLRKEFIQDALSRDTRVRHGLPTARPSRIDADLPPIVRAALQNVQSQARRKVAGFLTNHQEDAPAQEGPDAKFQERRELALGLQEFRKALTSTLLEQPETLQTIHPQYLYFTQPPLPWKVSDPWRSWLLIRLPLQIIFVLAVVFFSAYGWAYYRFNDEVLAEFLSEEIGSIIDGDLEFGSVHWGPTLALDLLIRRPHPVEIHEVRVYEGYKYVRQPGGPLEHQPAIRRETAYAQHLIANLVLHEIIPWNRLGVPRVFNIPWYLHFTELKSLGEIWIGARSYYDEESKSEKISLTDAFGPSDDSPMTMGYRRLSFRVDDTQFPRLTVPLDFLEDGEWGAKLVLNHARIRLRYDGDYPEREQEQEDLPIKYLLNAQGGHGEVVMLDEQFRINKIDELEIGAGYGDYPMGDMTAVLKAKIEGAQCELSGALTDVFLDKSGVDTRMRCASPDGLFTTIMPVEPGDTGPILQGGDRGKVALEISGSLDDPLMEFHAEGLQLDAQLDPELRVQDASLVATLRSLPIPDAMVELYSPVGARQEHWTVLFENFSGTLMQGRVRTPLSALAPRLILPEHAEPFVFSGGFELKQLQLDKGGSMVPSIYAGAHGGLQVQRLVFGEALGAAGPKPPAIPVRERFGALWPGFLPDQRPLREQALIDPPMDLQLLALHIPKLQLQDPTTQSQIPARASLSGDFIWDIQNGLKLDDAQLSTAGAKLKADLHLNAELNHIAKGKLDLDISDGEALFGGLGLPTFTPSLQSSLAFQGPIDRLSGPPGPLSSPGANLGGIKVKGLEQASLQWNKGRLSLDVPELLVLGGKGPLKAEFWPSFAEKGDPKMRAELKLKALAQEKLLGWPVSFSNAELDFIVDNGRGKPRSIYDIQARGHAFIPQLTMAKVRYRNARAAFVITPERIEIDELSLRYGRALSPKLAPNLRVSTGFFAVHGSLGLSGDPQLDLAVRSSGLPLRALTNFAGGSIPVRGRIGQGSSVTVKGRVSQPQVEGRINLASVNAANLPLGRGKLEFTSHRRTQGKGSRRMDIREVRVQGQLKTPAQKRSGLTLDATLAVGRNRRGTEFRELAGKGAISTVPLEQLLALPHQQRWKSRIAGALKGLSIEASYCPSGSAMLPACKARHDQSTPGRKKDKELRQNALALDLRLEEGWAGVHKSGNKKALKALTRCPAFASACMNTPLHTRLSEGTLELARPWELLTGPARSRSKLLLEGSFDLREPKAAKEGESCTDFAARVGAAKAPSSVTGSSTRGKIRGSVDLSGLDPAILPLQVGPMRGRVNLDLEMVGPLRAPWVLGRITNQSRSLSWTLAQTESEQQQPIQLRLTDLDIDVQGELATIEAQVLALRGQLSLGRGPQGSTAVGLTGACRGEYAVHLGPNSKLDVGLFRLLFPEEIEQSEGSIGIPQFSMQGNWTQPFRAGAPALKAFRARLSMSGHNAEFSVADQDLRVRSGEIDVHLCQPGDPCAGSRGDEGLAVRIGSASALDSTRPMDAVGVQSDSSGRTQYLWGHLTIPPELSSLRFAQLSMELNQFPYRQDDNAGRPELVAHLSSKDLRLRVTPDGFRRISGHLSADKARWLRDASQGVRSVVSFADPVPRPPSTLSPTLAALELDLDLKTTSPFRVDNNILRGLEAQAELHLGGTVGAMELTGPIEVQQGVLDLALLGGAYVIDHGRVRLNRRIADSEVDISATRKAPVRIENELHQVTLDLDGPLDAIRWRCHSTAQRNRGLQTLRGCIDYLIFDAGNAALTPQEEIDTGSLNLTRRSLTLLGNLTQVELNRFVEDELPRTGELLPIVRGRVRQLGLELQIQTREDWFSWRWGRLGLGYSYLRGYSGSFLRASQSLSSQLHLLDDVALEMQLGLRNYSNVALVLQPPRFGSVELGHRIRIPGFR